MTVIASTFECKLGYDKDRAMTDDHDNVIRVWLPGVRPAHSVDVQEKTTKPSAKRRGRNVHNMGLTINTGIGMRA